MLIFPKQLDGYGWNFRQSEKILYSIIIAKMCENAKNIILTSNDESILDIGKKYKLDVIKRPEYLSV